jgi:hypothetical protein
MSAPDSLASGRLPPTLGEDRCGEDRVKRCGDRLDGARRLPFEHLGRQLDMEFTLDREEQADGREGGKTQGIEIGGRPNVGCGQSELRLTIK